MHIKFMLTGIDKQNILNLFSITNAGENVIVGISNLTIMRL